MNLRPIELTDIDELFAVRVVTDENRLTREELTHLGITSEWVREKLTTTCAGWLCEVDQCVVGFAMGDSATGELLVIAVLPEYICRGIGSQLIARVEEWLWSKGCTKLWLTTDIDTTLRAYSFFRKHGWRDSEIRDGLRYMEKCQPTKVK